jgi:protoporphyrinogen oxidase
MRNLSERYVGERITILKVGVIGGGLAGLTCAYELRKAGIAPIVFEKDVECGGRIKNITESASDVPVGAIMFTLDYTALISLMKELGLERAIERVSLSESTLLIGAKPLSLNPWSLVRSRLLPLGVKLEIRKLWKLIAQLDPWSYPQELMKESLTQYLQSRISEETVECIVRPAVNAFFQDADRIAAGVGLQFLKSIPRVHVLTDGNAMITRALSASLEESILMGTEVNAAIEVKGKWRVLAATSWRELDSLICATTLSEARKLFPSADIRRLAYAPVNVLVVKGSYRYGKSRTLIDANWKESGIHSIKNLGRLQIIHARTSTPNLDRFYDEWEIVHLKHWKEALPIIEPGMGFQQVETGLPHLYLCGDFYLGGRMESAVRSAKAVVASILSRGS